MSGSLTGSNTLRVPSTADRVVTVRRESELVALLEELRRVGRRTGEPVSPLTVLGGGSNVVLLDHVPGTVCLMRTRGCRWQRGPGRSIEVTAAAGERWHDLVRFSLGQGLAGLENLSLIPGSVGAAPIQNVGAYGVELADRFVRLRALDTESGQVRVLERDACRFGYRNSLFKAPEGANLVVLDVTLRLHPEAPVVVDYPDLAVELDRLGHARPTATLVAEAVIRVRRRKLPDPRFTGNVGSFFKNPEVSPDRAQTVARLLPASSRRGGSHGLIKLSAAQLIEAAGWKGRIVGRVGIWHRQPLVLVNRGGASGRDILAVSEDIRRDVAATFGIDLEREPQVLGHN